MANPIPASEAEAAALLLDQQLAQARAEERERLVKRVEPLERVVDAAIALRSKHDSRDSWTECKRILDAAIRALK